MDVLIRPRFILAGDGERIVSKTFQRRWCHISLRRQGGHFLCGATGSAWRFASTPLRGAHFSAASATVSHVSDRRLLSASTPHKEFFVIAATQLKVGMVIMHNGKPHRVTNVLHV